MPKLTNQTIVLNYATYLDKVFGCWLGKCVSGTIGAPYEGMKQLLDIDYEPVLLDRLIPNDDLDLQVLWLDVLEKKGVHFTAGDLAEAFATRCPYAPGEYAVFKKNFRRGIAPPLCGRFNNRFYNEGMGAPIRAEIWACVAPGNPALAARYAGLDGSLDHDGESVYAEQFVAAMEAAAFVETDLDAVVRAGLAQIPADSRMASLIRDVDAWCRAGGGWQYVRSRIIRDYGHPSCTNLFQNMGFTMLAIFGGRQDLIDSTMIALNCGFDTDCSCATAGALLGILHGAEAIMSRNRLKDTGYLLEVDVVRRSNSIRDLAEDTARMGCYFAARVNDALVIEDAPPAPWIEGDKPEPVSFEVCYEDDLPAVGIGECRRLTIRLTNQSSREIAGRLGLAGPAGWQTEMSHDRVAIDPGESVSVQVQAVVPADLPVLGENNPFSLELVPGPATDPGCGTLVHRFGIAGAAVWRVFGPFWENSQTIRKLERHEHYTDLIRGASEDERIDHLHRYQNNNRIDFDRTYIGMGGEGGLMPPPIEDARYEARVVNLYTDRFSLDEISGFAGPGVFYLERVLISPEDRRVCLQVGHTDAFELWVNGESVARKENVDWSTSGNVNRLDFPLRAGENRVVVKLARHGSHADFSLIIRRTNPWRDHYDDLASKNPLA